jgi:tRNA (cytosine38-C5)-methyltransferase
MTKRTRARDDEDDGTRDDATARTRRGGKLRVLEMYCGVGVMHAALRRARGDEAEVCGAYDVNPNACDAYAMNYGTRPSQKSLVSVAMETLVKTKAEAWAMSPPCQPFTRAGLKLDVDDGRAESFMRLVDEMVKMDASARPKYVFVENVVGFETSRMRGALRDALSASAFHAQEFILTPTMFGVPYSRPRYFMLARSTRAFEDGVDEIRRSPPPSKLSHRREWIPDFDDVRDADVVVAPLSRFLDRATDDIWRANAVKQDDVDRAKGSIDIVTAEDTTCNCFTKSYYKYVKGTGSVVANQSVDKATWDGRMGDGASDVRLRYFTVDEVARLHSLPNDFAWPSNLTTRQKYTLLGNSMSVACVAPLLDYLFAD